MISNIFVVITLWLLVCSSLYAHDSNRIDQLEKPLSALESMIYGKKEKNEFINSGKGWESITNWRKLRMRMSENDVRKILGDPEKIDGGDFAFWYYPNDGRVTFIQGGVDGWSEPR